jgi:hypothetical protein
MIKSEFDKRIAKGKAAARDAICATCGSEVEFWAIDENDRITVQCKHKACELVDILEPDEQRPIKDN